MSHNAIAERVMQRHAANTEANWGVVSNNLRSLDQAMSKLQSAVKSENATATLNACASLVGMAARLATAASGDASLVKSARGVQDKIHAAAKEAPTE